MKQLVFALMLQTWSGGAVISTELVAYWYDLNNCLYFSRSISNQSQKQYSVPVDAYCIPKWVDSDNSEVQIF